MSETDDKSGIDRYLPQEIKRIVLARVLETTSVLIFTLVVMGLLLLWPASTIHDGFWMSCSGRVSHHCTRAEYGTGEFWLGVALHTLPAALVLSIGLAAFVSRFRYALRTWRGQYEFATRPRPLPRRLRRKPLQDAYREKQNSESR